MVAAGEDGVPDSARCSKRAAALAAGSVVTHEPTRPLAFRGKIEKEHRVG
jgi:hypothetical protein